MEKSTKNSGSYILSLEILNQKVGMGLKNPYFIITIGISSNTNPSQLFHSSRAKRWGKKIFRGITTDEERGLVIFQKYFCLKASVISYSKEKLQDRRQVGMGIVYNPIGQADPIQQKLKMQKQGIFSQGEWSEFLLHFIVICFDQAKCFSQQRGKERHRLK